MGLILLAAYATECPSWTESLDSFAVLRLGAAIADELPLISPVEADEVVLLDEKEGWIGESKERKPRRLVIGGPCRPKCGKPYCLIEDDGQVKLRRNGNRKTLR